MRGREANLPITVQQQDAKTDAFQFSFQAGRVVQTQSVGLIDLSIVDHRLAQAGYLSRENAIFFGSLDQDRPVRSLGMLPLNRTGWRLTTLGDIKDKDASRPQDIVDAPEQGS